MKSEEAYMELVKMFADGRKICNCGLAYYTNCGTAWRGDEKIENYPVCMNGCSANQIATRNEIAERVLRVIPSRESIRR